MTLSTTAKFWEQVALLAHSQEAAVLMVIDHPSFLEPIRIVNDTKDLVSRGETYIGWPAKFRLPGDGSGSKTAEVMYQNVGLETGDIIRRAKGDISILFDVVLYDEPDDSIYDHGGLKLRNVKVTGTYVSAEIVGHGTEAQPWPATRNSPARTPALYA
ncbi:MAG: DUF1833 family protein [Rhodospirillales bacterium]|jgi:hypothetical protein